MSCGCALRKCRSAGGELKFNVLKVLSVRAFKGRLEATGPLTKAKRDPRKLRKKSPLLPERGEAGASPRHALA